MKHQVAHAIGVHYVVCSCGAYFETPRVTTSLEPGNALQQWAQHLHIMNREVE